MKRTANLFVAIMLIAAMFTSCGGTASNVDTTAVQTTDTTAAVEGTETTAPEEESEWPRTYTDALGREVVIESEPQNPTLIFFRNFEHMFTLDIIPVAASDVDDVYLGWDVFSEYAEQYDIVDLGAMSTVNVEKLLEVDTDLIIVYSGMYEKIGEQLEQIATVITVNNYGDDWQTPLTEYGVIFGKEDEAAAEIERLKALISDASDELSEFEGKTFAFLKSAGDFTFSVYVLQYVYDEEAGLGIDAPEGYIEQSRAIITLEGLAEFNPDYIFVYDDALNASDEELLTNLKGESVWNALTAVKNENVYLIDRSAFSGGPMSIEYGIENILSTLGK